MFLAEINLNIGYGVKSHGRESEYFAATLSVLVLVLWGPRCGQEGGTAPPGDTREERMFPGLL